MFLPSRELHRGHIVACVLCTHCCWLCIVYTLLLSVYFSLMLVVVGLRRLASELVQANMLNLLSIFCGVLGIFNISEGN